MKKVKDRVSTIRTAYAALELLHGLRRRLNSRIPLAWLSNVTRHCAIEVYPAATLIAHGIDATGYKAPKGRQDRERIAEEIGLRIRMETDIPGMERASDGLDAVLCVLAAADFLSDTALPPEPNSPVVKEGWIWFRDPAAYLKTPRH